MLKDYFARMLSSLFNCINSMIHNEENPRGKSSPKNSSATKKHSGAIFSGLFSIIKPFNSRWYFQWHSLRGTILGIHLYDLHLVWREWIKNEVLHCELFPTSYFHLKKCLFYFDSLKVKLTLSFLFYREASGKTQSILLPLKMVKEAIKYSWNVNTLTLLNA